ncbi:hypothetical protein [Dyella caseinilytica]|uniref:Tn3 transposase DDE domain-containing protein n=1 Tax=Dyella caseinilytica TaxID=1849581 RepID=A0ABX7GTN4_9GAMM|nr:hypothetical protein [Dyella caseinilytica]QRN53815.1 hypothetical protein ISN74_20880 [Dyella caseinilytica]GFZ89383.1 hypothetical protein GCM10011408_05380 [Dyella caseinilytica]
MSSLWTDLLYLHGYLTDHKLARRLANGPPDPPAPKADSPPSVKAGKVQRVTWYARLCLGIGDGGLRTQ